LPGGCLRRAGINRVGCGSSHRSGGKECEESGDRELGELHLDGVRRSVYCLERSFVVVECLVPLLSVEDVLESWITITLKGEVESLYIDEFGLSHMLI
jgi:hypothetical protein